MSGPMNRTAAKVLELVPIAKAEFEGFDKGICACRVDGVLVVVAVDNSHTAAAERIADFLESADLVGCIEEPPAQPGETTE